MRSLQEVMGLHQFLKTLFKPEFKPLEDKSKAKAKCVEITKKIILPLGAKILKTKDKSDDEAIDLLFTVKLGEDKVIVHTTATLKDGNFQISLWDEDHQSLIDILCHGPIEGEYLLRGLGKSRLKKWVK